MAEVLVEVPADAEEEARAFNVKLEELLASLPAANTVAPETTRRARAEGRGLFGPIERSARAETGVVHGPQGEVRVRILRPHESPRAVYLHFHGGGWTFGGADEQDPMFEALADRAGVAVVSVDYRLAPESPYPAGPDDCEAAACWLVEHAEAEFGTGRLLVGGESARAHLAVVTLLRLRDRHAVTGRFAGANLVFGCYDLSLTPSVRNWGHRDLVLSTPVVEWFTENFVPGRSREERRDPDISPLYAELAGLPPALFTVGSLDALVDDNLFMAARWRQAGNAGRLLVYPQSPHAFTAFPTAVGRMGNREQIRFVAEMASG